MRESTSVAASFPKPLLSKKGAIQSTGTGSDDAIVSSRPPAVDDNVGVDDITTAAVPEPKVAEASTLLPIASTTRRSVVVFGPLYLAHLTISR